MYFDAKSQPNHIPFLPRILRARCRRVYVRSTRYYSSVIGHILNVCYMPCIQLDNWQVYALKSLPLSSPIIVTPNLGVRPVGVSVSSTHRIRWYIITQYNSNCTYDILE